MHLRSSWQIARPYPFTTNLLLIIKLHVGSFPPSDLCIGVKVWAGVFFLHPPEWKLTDFRAYCCLALENCSPRFDASCNTPLNLHISHQS